MTRGLEFNPIGFPCFPMWLCRAIAFLLLLSVAGVSSSADHAAIDWKDLIPDDWETPLILPAPRTGDEHHVAPESLNAQLSGRKVMLPGYLKPIIFSERFVTEFLLVPFLEQQAQRHVHHDANQMVYVKLATSVEIKNPYIPYWVTGIISLESVNTEDGPTGYTISSAQIIPYEY